MNLLKYASLAKFIGLEYIPNIFEMVMKAYTTIGG